MGEGAALQQLFQGVHHAFGAGVPGNKRPPYGKLDEAQKAQIPVPMVQWSVDSRDWESKNTEKIVETVLAQAEPNNIILMHDIYPTSVEAALKIVDMLQAEGYWFVKVEELLCLNGIEPQARVLYRFGK